MLSEEEKEAIQMIKNQKNDVDEALIAMENPENYIGEDVEQEYLEWQKNAEIVLNLIEKQQKEIERLKSLDIYKLVEDWEKGELVSKDKIRELMNKNIGQYMSFYREIEKLLEE